MTKLSRNIAKAKCELIVLPRASVNHIPLTEVKTTMLLELGKLIFRDRLVDRRGLETEYRLVVGQ
jgi:hypothetical protein